MLQPVALSVVPVMNGTASNAEGVINVLQIVPAARPAVNHGVNVARSVATHASVVVIVHNTLSTALTVGTRSTLVLVRGALIVGLRSMTTRRTPP